MVFRNDNFYDKWCTALLLLDINNDIDKRNGTWDILMSSDIYNILILTLA